MRTGIIFVMLMAVLGVRAQREHQWEQYLNQVMTVEDMESEEWQLNYDLLCELERHPININMTSREELEELMFLSAQQIEAIIEYLYRYGEMKSTAELQMITEIGPQTRQLLECFIYVGNGPKASTRTKHELMINARVPLNNYEGDENGYLGSNCRHWFRYQMEQGGDMKLGLVASQDAGEPFFSDRNKYGYDYYSPYLQLRKMGRLETLVAGNFRVSMGMGMVMNNSFGLGKIATLQNLGRHTAVLRAHSSRTIGYLQGVGATLNLGKGLKTTAFVSYTPMDATLNKDGSARTIITSGYHRTETEMAKKHNLHAFKTGGSLRYDAGRLHLALNALYAHLDRKLSPDKSYLYNYYRPEGTEFKNASIDYGYRSSRWALNGETATDGSGHIATINTISMTTNSGLSILALQRYYSYRYTSLDAQSYSDGNRVQNESGVYVGLSWQPTPRWQITAYTDYAYHPWTTYREKSSSYSWDNLLQCVHTSDKWKLTARYRFKVKENQHFTRLSAEYTSQNFSSRTQFDGGYMAEKESELGAMLNESVTYACHWLRLNAGIGYFHTDSYNSRVYLYESGPLYTYSMQQFYGEGIRYWLMLRAQAGRNLMFTAKIGATDYFDRRDKTDIDLQVRMKI